MQKSVLYFFASFVIKYNKVLFITISFQNVKPNAKHACRQRLLGKNLEML